MGWRLREASREQGGVGHTLLLGALHVVIQGRTGLSPLGAKAPPPLPHSHILVFFFRQLFRGH